MKYKPARDIPKAVQELKTLSPSVIAQWVQDHRTEKHPETGRRVQASITPEAVIMWLKRHKKEKENLEKQIKFEELEQTAISETLFENGIFWSLSTVKTWVLELRGRNAKEETIKSFVNNLKRICKGEIRDEIIEGWGLKHPDRLNLEDSLTYISEMKKRKLPTREYRLTLRNFLQSKGVKGYHKISGAIAQYGKYAHLFAPKSKIDAILYFLKANNTEAYFASKFAFKCGGVRHTATLNAEASKINYEDHSIFVEEKATRGKGKRIQEKLIPLDFWEELQPRIKKGGKLFNIESNELNKILRDAYKTIIPELAKEIKMPFHFWRHQFAQHGLRATNWNYGLIARLGHWTVETLERYYGKMDRQTAFNEGNKFLLNL